MGTKTQSATNRTQMALRSSCLNAIDMYGSFIGAPEGIRTPDQELRRPALGLFHSLDLYRYSLDIL